MERLTPRAKLFAAGGLLALLALFAVLGGRDGVLGARVLLGLAAVAGLGWWLSRTGGAHTALQPPRLRVLQRAGLSPRCGLALVALDGREYLVVHGDGFAEVHAPPLAPAQARRPTRRSRRTPGGAR